MQQQKELLVKWAAEGTNKVLIFSGSVKLLKIIKV